MGEPLPAEVQVALAWARAADRPAFNALFQLDRRLGEVVAGSSETMIGQLRLAWWRDMLAKPVEEWPRGEPLLAAIKASWGDSTQHLGPLVDGWEQLLVAEELDAETVRLFAAGRQAGWLALARQIDPVAPRTVIAASAFNWALADLVVHLSNNAERELVLDIACEEPGLHGPIPRRLRPFLLLGKLGQRALESGGRPLMDSRLAALRALRIGIFGR